MEHPIRILLVDDQPSIRRGLRMRLGIEPDIEIVGEASDGGGALDLASAAAPDVVLMDIEMPSMDGITATSRLGTIAPGCAVVILTIHDDIMTREGARAAGAAEFVTKHEVDRFLMDAIRRAARRR
jgi:DNA-binding NarL/FixJ family response regulator